MKKFISLFLSAILIFSVCIGGVTANADEVFGDFEYSISETDTATITKYTGSSETVTIPAQINGYPVTEIDSSCFYEHSEIKSVTFPDSLRTIGQYAFGRCTGLTSIVIPDNVRIDASFIGCTGLESVTIGENSQLWDAFIGCSSLTQVAIGEGIKSLGGFKNCTALKSFIVPDSVAYISSAAFSGCENLKNITMGKNIETLSERAFENCSSLTSVELPDTVKAIDKYVFMGCKNLTQLTLSSNLELIGQRAFQDCSSLESLVIPDGVTVIEESTFENCTSLTSLTLGKATTTIGTSAFSNCGFSEITLPDSLETLGVYAFAYSKISEITIPDGVTTIPYNAFVQCTNLKRVNLPNSITEIGNYAFDQCKSLTDINFPDSLTTIGNDSFWGCSSLTTISIPDSVTTLGKEAFSKCTNLTDVSIGNRLTTISESAFAECYNLQNITIPGSVTTIEKYAFSYCRSLIELTLPSGVNFIGYGAFSKCFNLCIINFGTGQLTVENNAFQNCTRLDHVMYPGYKAEWDHNLIDVNGNSYLMNATYHYNSKSTDIRYEIKQKEDCTQNGTVLVVCSKCNNRKEISTAKKDHKFYFDSTIPATCTEYSKDVYKCRTCSEQYANANDVEKPLGHTEVVSKGTQATYFKNGNTEYTYCSACKEILTETREISKLKLNKPVVSYMGGKKKITIKYKKVKDATGFEVKYKLGKKSYTKNFDTKKNVTKVIKKLNKGNYKIQLRAYIKQGKKIAYSNWTTAKKVKVK